MIGTDAGSPTCQGQMLTTTLPATTVMTQMGGNSVMIQGDLMQPAAAAVASLGQGQVVSGGTVYQMVQTPQGLVAQPIQVSFAKHMACIVCFHILNSFFSEMSV